MLLSGRGGRWLATDVASRGEIRRELIELEFPEPPVAFDPRRRAAHRRGDECRAADASLPPHPSESSAFQNVDVLGNCRQGHDEARRELADRPLASRQAGDYGASGGVGERGERRIEGPVMVNHMV